LLLDRLGELVDEVDSAGRVHPAGMLVEALVDEELAPGGGAVSVQPLVAGYLLLGAEEEAGVRVDQEQGVAVRGVGRRDREAVRTPRLLIRGCGRGGEGFAAARIKGLQRRWIDPLDIAADRAFGEGERHPRLEP